MHSAILSITSNYTFRLMNATRTCTTFLQQCMVLSGVNMPCPASLVLYFINTGCWKTVPFSRSKKIWIWILRQPSECRYYAYSGESSERVEGKFAGIKLVLQKLKRRFHDTRYKMASKMCSCLKTHQNLITIWSLNLFCGKRPIFFSSIADHVRGFRMSKFSSFKSCLVGSVLLKTLMITRLISTSILSFFLVP